AVPGMYHLAWLPQDESMASLIICSRSPALADKCLSAIQKKTAHPRFEVILVHHVTDDNDTAMQQVIQRHRARCVRYTGPFHFSLMNNLAAKTALGETLVFLNDDVEPLVDRWLSDLVGQVQRPEVGAAGARLVYPSGALQHG